MSRTWRSSNTPSGVTFLSFHFQSAPILCFNYQLFPRHTLAAGPMLRRGGGSLFWRVGRKESQRKKVPDVVSETRKVPHTHSQLTAEKSFCLSFPQGNFTPPLPITEHSYICHLRGESVLALNANRFVLEQIGQKAYALYV